MRQSRTDIILRKPYRTGGYARYGFGIRRIQRFAGPTTAFPTTPRMKCKSSTHILP